MVDLTPMSIPIDAPWRLLSPVALLAWALLLWTLPRGRAAWLTLFGAAGVLVATWAPRLHLHRGYAYAELRSALGHVAPSHVYGEGWTALLSPVLSVLGHPRDGVHAVVPVLAWLAVGQAVALAARLTGDRRAGVWVGALLAVSPCLLALAPTESRYVPLTACVLLAVHGLLRGDRVGQWMTLVGGALVAELRPLEGLFTVALIAVVLARRGWWVAAGLLAVVAERLVAWQGAPWRTPGLQFDNLLRLDWIWQVAGHDAGAVVLDPWRVPVVLLPLAVVGAWTWWRSWTVRGLVVLVLVDTMLTVHQTYSSDRLRYQLPAVVVLTLLAGLGAAAWATTRGRTVALLGGLAMSTWLAARPYRTMTGAEPPWQTEHVVLRQALATLTPGSVVAWHPAHPWNELAAWVEEAYGVRLVDVADAGPDVRWRWVGLSDHASGEVTAPGTPVVVSTLTLGADDLWGCDAPCPTGRREVGLYAR